MSVASLVEPFGWFDLAKAAAILLLLVDGIRRVIAPRGYARTPTADELTKRAEALARPERYFEEHRAVLAYPVTQTRGWDRVSGIANILVSGFIASSLVDKLHAANHL